MPTSIGLELARQHAEVPWQFQVQPLVRREFNAAMRDKAENYVR